MQKSLAPIALFVYNRPHHTKKTIEALKKNPESRQSELFIFSDGPKSKDASQKVNEVRKYLKTTKGFKKINIIKREKNIGLAKSITTGIKKVLSKHEKIIVLEDDIQTSKHFLKFMNDSLDTYKEDKKVFGVTGYVYPAKQKLPETFFVKLSNCWGWATWKRAWNFFEGDGDKLISQIKSKRKFDIENSYPYFKMLKNQIKGKNNSWAIRWYASIFLKGGLFLYPGKSLVDNIGFGGDATHCDTENFFQVKISSTPVKVSRIKVIENEHARKQFHKFFRSILLKRILNKIKRILNKK